MLQPNFREAKQVAMVASPESVSHFLGTLPWQLVLAFLLKYVRQYLERIYSHRFMPSTSTYLNINSISKFHFAACDLLDPAVKYPTTSWYINKGDCDGIIIYTEVAISSRWSSAKVISGGRSGVFKFINLFMPRGLLSKAVYLVSRFSLIIIMFIEIPELNAHSVVTDQRPHSWASDLGLCGLQMSLLWDTRLKWV